MSTNRRANLKRLLFWLSCNCGNFRVIMGYDDEQKRPVKQEGSC